MAIIVRRPGLLTTVQDLGRHKYQRYGVSVSGAMDPYACACANLLVGNEPSAALLECTMTGAALYFTEPAVIAICGADMQPTVQGTAVPSWRPVYIREDTLLVLGSARYGARTYIAFAGGLQTESRMGSQATYLRAGLGGYEGRALREGDRLSSGAPSKLASKLAEALTGHSRMSESVDLHEAFIAARWSLGLSARPRYDANPRVRFLPGMHYDRFDEESLADLTRTVYRVSPQSDRMGCRLNGRQLRLREPAEMWSEAVTFGTVQVPPDGEPIILTADRQTTGGYPVIAQIVSVDLPLVAQTPIGGTISFERVDIHEAQRLLLDAHQDMKKIASGIRLLIGH